MQASRQFRTDRSSESGFGLQQLISVASRAGQELTFTCVPLDMGEQMALDRDGDGVADGD